MGRISRKLKCDLRAIVAQFSHLAQGFATGVEMEFVVTQMASGSEFAFAINLEIRLGKPLAADEVAPDLEPLGHLKPFSMVAVSNCSL